MNVYNDQVEGLKQTIDLHYIVYYLYYSVDLYYRAMADLLYNEIPPTFELIFLCTLFLSDQY